MEWIFNQLRERPELAIFLTIFLGFWLGKLRIGKFSLGTVTSVLLVGVMVGQLNIAVPGPIKSVFFLLFLFAVGYKVGPQFFRGLKKDGLPQVAFAVLMCISVLGVTWLLALLMGYNMGEAAGLADHIRRHRSGRRYNGKYGSGRSAAAKLHQYHPGVLCRNLHLRNSRIRVGIVVHRSENAGRTG